MLWKWDASKCVHTSTQTKEMHECDLRYNLVCTMLWKWDASKCVHTGTQTEEMTECGLNVMEMWYGLTLTWESLSPTHIGCRWMKMKCLEMRAHGHANWENDRMQSKIQPSMHYAVKMRNLEMRAHRHANWENGRMQSKIQPSMHYAMKMRCLEMRAHGHANRENDRMQWKWDASKCVHTGTQTEAMTECNVMTWKHDMGLYQHEWASATLT